ncbi:MAG: hypothetical protein CM15mP53_05020 [Ectothiorhodospiraceae bacterium]|nr:MAG: hypothetical protein CM15mP53_05020 [Ectothiorhodospiraceae bacterium]
MEICQPWGSPFCYKYLWEKKYEYTFLGAPGSGKGPKPKKIKNEFNFPQISTGGFTRAETESESKMGQELKKYYVIRKVCK